MKTDFPNSSQSFSIYHRGNNINSNVHMFQEDISQSIMPYSDMLKYHKEFIASFVGTINDNEEATKICRSIMHDSHSNNVSDLICRCIEEIVRFLAWDGRLLCEIVFDKEDNQLRLCEVTTKNLYEIPFGFVQIPPLDEQEHEKRFNFLNARNLWKIEMPLLLGGKQGYRNILSRLRKFDSLGPNFYREDLGNSVLSNRFDYTDYRQENFVFTTKSTLNWKWDQRDIDRDEKTEFYMFYQDLSFKWAQTILREHIVKELNLLFENLEIDSKIVISGIPTSDDIKSYQKKIISGEKNLDDILKYLFY